MRALAIVLLYVIPLNGQNYHREGQIARWRDEANAWMRERAGGTLPYSATIQTMTMGEYIDTGFALDHYLRGMYQPNTLYVAYLESLPPISYCGEAVRDHVGKRPLAVIYPTRCVGHTDIYNALLLLHETLHLFDLPNVTTARDLMNPNFGSDSELGDYDLTPYLVR